MWKNHLNLHMQSILPGSVPEDWLGQNNMVICSYCFHFVASSHLQSHHGKCPLKPASTGVQLSQDSPSNADATTQIGADALVSKALSVRRAKAGSLLKTIREVSALKLEENNILFGQGFVLLALNLTFL